MSVTFASYRAALRSDFEHHSGSRADVELAFLANVGPLSRQHFSKWDSGVIAKIGSFRFGSGCKTIPPTQKKPESFWRSDSQC